MTCRHFRRPSLREPTGWMRMALLVQGFGWAIALYLPGETFKLSASFNLLADIMTEEHWCWLWAAESLACLVGLFLAAGQARGIIARVCCGLNALLAIAFWLNPVPSPGVGEHAAFLVISLSLVLHERQAQ